MSSNTHSLQFVASDDNGEASSQLCVRDQGGAWRPASGDEIISAARAALARKVRRGTAFESPHMVRDYLKLKLSALEHEVFSVIFLDNRHRLIAYGELFRGTIDGATVYAREVVKEALLRNAAAVIFAHNHPSGIAEPSEADRSITIRLSKALALVEIRVLDHIIVAGDAHVSFAERGLL